MIGDPEDRSICSEPLTGVTDISVSAADDIRHNAVCPACGYSLRGLPIPRCPECGATFSWHEAAGAASEFLTPWELSTSQFGVRAFLATAGLWVLHPVLFLRNLAGRRNVALRQPISFVFLCILLLATALGLTYLTYECLVFLLCWPDPIGIDLIIRTTLNLSVSASCDLAGFVASALAGTMLFWAVGLKRYPLFRGMSGLCTACVLFLPLVILLQAHILLRPILMWLFHIRIYDYVATEFICKLFIPISAGIGVIVIGRMIGNISWRRAGLILPLAFGMFHLSWNLVIQFAGELHNWLSSGYWRGISLW